MTNMYNRKSFALLLHFVNLACGTQETNMSPTQCCVQFMVHNLKSTKEMSGIVDIVVDEWPG